MTLKLYLLGGLSITLDDLPIKTLVTQKAALLLVYLALEPREHSREILATLLWEESSQVQSLGNLRTLLTSLRKSLDSYLIVTRKTVGINRQAEIWLDTDEFTRKISAPETVEAALALYAGDFLQGIYPRDSRELEAWIDATREQLRQSALTARRSLIQHQLDAGEYESGIQHATSLLKQDSLNEDVLRALMSLYARSGQRETALAQYQTFEVFLQDELGVAPAPETTALYKRIRAAAPAAATLPSPGTSFVGRKHELMQITRQLRQPDCRLLTLVGLGGSGKTRLALQAAAHLREDFLNGVVLVSLHGVQTGDFMIAEIAESLQFPLRGQTSDIQQLGVFLQHKEILLVLDNCEHMLDDVRNVVERILAAAPAVKFLLTSRLRLALQAESLLEVRGLPLGSESDSPALTLFVQRARAVSANFELTPENTPDARRLCEIVEGSPLGIELAAAWTRALTCAQIVESLESNLDLLSTQLRDVPERQRSMRAIFDYAWSQLDAPAQSLAARLGVFASSFDVDAVTAIAKAPPYMMANLVEKSIVQMSAGRYHIIEAFQAYALEKLQAKADEYQQSVTAHRIHYLARLKRQKYAPQALRSDMDNIRTAWLRTIEARDHAQLETSAADLCDVFIARGAYLECEQLLNRAIDALRQQNAQPALACLLVGLACIKNQISQYDVAFDLAHEALQIGTDCGQVYSQALSYWQQACSLWRRDAYDKALPLIEQSVRLAQQNHFAAVEAGAQRDRGVIAIRQHEYELAREALDSALKLYRKLGDRHGEGGVLNNFGIIAWYQGNLSIAKSYFEQDLAICRELGDVHGEIQTLGNLAYICVALGSYDEADKLYHGTLEMHRQLGDRYGEAWTLVSLGEMAIERGFYYGAMQLFEQSLPMSREIESKWLESNSLVMLGEACRQMGAYETALNHLLLGLQVKMEIGEKYADGVVRNYISRLLTVMGDLKQAQQYAQAALQIGEEASDDLIRGEALLVLAQVQTANGEWDEARKRAQQALEIVQGKEHFSFTQDARLTLAEICLLHDQPVLALEHVNFILENLSAHSIATALRPVRLCHIVSRVLADQKDPRHADFQTQAQAFALACKTEIQDATLRELYLNRVVAPLLGFLA